MTDYRRVAKMALKAYLERGKNLLSAFEQGSGDRELGYLLQTSTAAFHLFRYADEKCRNLGDDLVGDPEIREAMEKAALVHGGITAALQNRLQELDQESAKLRRVMGNLRTYRSGRLQSQAVQARV